MSGWEITLLKACWIAIALCALTYFVIVLIQAIF